MERLRDSTQLVWRLDQVAPVARRRSPGRRPDSTVPLFSTHRVPDPVAPPRLPAAAAPAPSPPTARAQPPRVVPPGAARLPPLPLSPRHPEGDAALRFAGRAVVEPVPIEAPLLEPIVEPVDEPVWVPRTTPSRPPPVLSSSRRPSAFGRLGRWLHVLLSWIGLD